MKTSLKGILAIINEEALVLSTYTDSAGVLTIGVGHTALAGGMAPRLGGRITIEQAIALLASDLARFERRVAASVKRALAQHEFDALVSFDFNTGAIAGGTVDDKLARGDIAGAMATLQQYDKAAGRKLAGLDRRRDSEEAMFRHGTYPETNAIKVYDTWPGKLRLVPVSLLDLSTFSAPPDVVANTQTPARPRGLLAAFIDLMLAIFKRRSGQRSTR
jgi:GH24 family phage-related lysozyme (muramidase)